MRKLKLKTKNHNLRVKAFEFYTTGLLFSFFIFCLSASLGYAQNSSKQLPTQVNKKQGHLLIAKNPTTELEHQLWQARISNLKDRKPNISKSELYRIIKKIRSVKFEQQAESAESLIVIEPTPKTETKKAEAEPKSPFSSKRQDEKQSLAGQITNQTLEIFERLSQQPQQLKNPFGLAEILFGNGSLRESAKCYQEALDRMAANKDKRDEERAWVLFQIGNCLRNTDQPAAIEMYQQLI
ncbi:MAG: tetratricopeptide repeat protein, partial [Planctomycetota bacterium]